MNFPATLPINYNNTALFYPDDTSILGSFTKAPDAQTLVSLDYTGLLINQYAGFTIQSIGYLLNFGSAPQLVVSGTTIQANNNIVSFIISGGLNGLKYMIQVNATMSDGVTVNVQYLEVVVSSPGAPAGNCDQVMGRIGVAGPPISTTFQEAAILNGDNTRFGSSFIVFWVGSNAPPTANILDRWYNTTDGLIYDRATDGYSVFWVTSAQRPTQYTTSSTAPTNPSIGDIWFNTSTNTVNIWINTGTGNNWFAI